MATIDFGPQALIANQADSDCFSESGSMKGSTEFEAVRGD